MMEYPKWKKVADLPKLLAASTASLMSSFSLPEPR
jgi:hypothetical protein